MKYNTIFRSILSGSLFFGSMPFAVLSGQNISEWSAHVAQNGKNFPQEKVYLHLDNTCYFQGDTIWFKTYVTRTDTKKPTDLSKICYVELLSPDGFVVERQQIPLENDTTGYGNFVLSDSLYGGFYELRAYTRWMLNFGRIEPERIPQKIGLQDYFFNTDAMKDFFVDYEKIYSRVFPVYDKPATPGAYELNMTMRPMMRYFKTKKEKPELRLSFYPEGGNLIQGADCRVAYELTDKQLKKLQAPITIYSPDGSVLLTTKPNSFGRGTFVLPQVIKGKNYMAQIHYEGYDYEFRLPDAEASGCALQLAQTPTHLDVKIQASGLPQNTKLGLHILQSGLLRKDTVLFAPNEQNTQIRIPTSDLPTGVNQLTLFDSSGRIYADRLFFVAHKKDMKKQLIIDSNDNQEYEAFAPIELTLSHTASAPAHLSLSVSDASTQVSVYDNGNIFTEMLLSSELKGFIENPNYYFEADDSTHQADLDLLMLVQGWRRYKWTDLAGLGNFKLNYLPEKYQTLSGRIYKKYGNERNATFDSRNILQKYSTQKQTEPLKAQEYLDRNYRTINRPAVIHADYVQDTLVVETEQVTENGYFYMATPRFFGPCILFLSANDSIQEQKQNEPSKNKMQRWIKNKMERINGFANEEAFPEYYVKRDLFFPLKSHPFSYYQDNLPDDTFLPYETEHTEAIYKLPEISIRTTKGGLRKFNRKKPALVLDAYRVFNDALDWGVVYSPRYYKDSLNETNEMLRRFPFVYTGDYGTNTLPRISLEFNHGKRADTWGGAGKLESYRYLKYMKEFRIYTDFAPRERGNSNYSGANTPEIRIDAVQYDENIERQTYRDRYIILTGFAECDAFYSPDYSVKPLPEQKDYRRTLYWNPDIRLQPGEKRTIKFYNNGKKTRVRIDAEGLSQDGTLLY